LEAAPSIRAVAAACRPGGVPAVIGGRRICFRTGAACRLRYERAYAQKGFRCSAGRLRRLTAPRKPSPGQTVPTTTVTTTVTTTATSTPSACVPTDQPDISSTNPNCFDGDAARGVFISTSGNDNNSGTMAAPMRTLGAGLKAAFSDRKDVYVTGGTFPEVLVVANGVNVFGGYDANWQRSPTNITRITGTAQSPWAADAEGIGARTTLQSLTLIAPTPTSP
jgi:hypothetical protein